MPVSDRETTQAPCAFIIPSKDIVVSEELKQRIHLFCQENMEPLYRPERIIFVTEFPLTKIGKVDYRKLEEMANSEGRELKEKDTGMEDKGMTFEISLGLNEIYSDLTANRRAVNEFLRETILEKGEISDADAEKAYMLMTLGEIKRRIRNKVGVRIYADKIIENFSYHNIHRPSDDWLVYFEELSSRVSNPHMQEIWAKLLVKEHIENGSVPYAMLNILALMDRNSALAFQKICALTYILDDDDMGRHYIPLVLYDDMLHNIIEHNLQHDTYIQIYKIMTEYEQYLPAQQDLQFLEELGLLKLSTLHDESEIFSHKHRKVRYQVGDKCIETESLHSDDYEYEFVLVGQAFYTQIGEKLYHALAVEPFQKLFDVLELFCCFNEEMEV